MINKLLPVKGNPPPYVHDNNDRIRNKPSSNLPDVFLIKAQNCRENKCSTFLLSNDQNNRQKKKTDL